MPLAGHRQKAAFFRFGLTYIIYLVHPHGYPRCLDSMGTALPDAQPRLYAYCC
ncbi:hypothetical protein BLL52_0513 [Rhodoferax antarcticus ANT.BR]|uniref:Uncharacterized protein n=1 Tax=Rhodoferax antarcticus ANT.BR TaxID=1111071 RepID=A0A1Q8YJT0_9BURK|nr:hypothetical protein BLL52_0513 [Rhodoferax antarcticus ANT.BR]